MLSWTELLIKFSSVQVPNPNSFLFRKVNQVRTLNWTELNQNWGSVQGKWLNWTLSSVQGSGKRVKNQTELNFRITTASSMWASPWQTAVDRTTAIMCMPYLLCKHDPCVHLWPQWHFGSQTLGQAKDQGLRISLWNDLVAPLLSICG